MVIDQLPDLKNSCQLAQFNGRRLRLCLKLLADLLGAYLENYFCYTAQGDLNWAALIVKTSTATIEVKVSAAASLTAIAAISQGLMATYYYYS